MEAAPQNSTNPADFVTVTRLFNATNATEFPAGEFAIMTENISCTLCHLRVTTLDELDGQLTKWVKEAYAVGCQEHLAAVD